MLLAAPPFLSFINRGDQNALAAVYTLAPAVFFGSLSAVYRGYYEGLGDMRPTAFSEVAEAVCKACHRPFGFVLCHAPSHGGI